MIKIGYNYDMYILNPYIYGGGPSFTNDYSLQFDGVDEYVDCGRVTATESTANISISCWVKITSTGDKLIWGKYLSSSNGFYLSFSDTLDRLQLQLQNGAAGSGAFSTTNSFLKNQWNHVVCTYDGTAANTDRLDIYINGANVVGTIAGTIPTTTSSLTEVWQIASIGGFSASYMGGLIDEHAIFDYTLTSAQVTSLYNSGVQTDLDNTT